jgi:hypothetical protein
MKLNLMVRAAETSSFMTCKHIFVNQQSFIFYVISYYYSANGEKRNAYKVLDGKYCDVTAERRNIGAREMAVVRLWYSKHHVNLAASMRVTIEIPMGTVFSVLSLRFAPTVMSPNCTVTARRGVFRASPPPPRLYKKSQLWALLKPKTI